MKFILGTKSVMTQVYDDSGLAYPATVVKVSPATVTQVKTVATDGYDAVQIASGEQLEKRLNKAEIGHLGGAFKAVKEFRPRANKKESIEGVTKGQVIDVGIFAPGDKVVVRATSKGKGFQGGVKRHGFKGGPRTHGNKHHERAPGSIGAAGWGRVFKGTRMAGRMGHDLVTVKNLKVLQVNPAENLLVINGALPGRKGALVEIRSV